MQEKQDLKKRKKEEKRRTKPEIDSYLISLKNKLL